MYRKWEHLLLYNEQAMQAKKETIFYVTESDCSCESTALNLFHVTTQCFRLLMQRQSQFVKPLSAEKADVFPVSRVLLYTQMCKEQVALEKSYTKIYVKSQLLKLWQF